MPYALDWIKLLLENRTKTNNADTTIHYYSTYHASLSAQILTQSFQSSTAICEKNISCCTSILLLSIKNDDDNLQNNILISNHLAHIMLRTYSNNNDSNNAATITLIQYILNSTVFKFKKDNMSLFLASLESKVHATMMNSTSSK